MSSSLKATETGSREILPFVGPVEPHLLERLVAAIERIADYLQSDPPQPPRPERVVSRECRAIRALAETGPDNLSEIARMVGVHRRTLNKWPVFMEAVERMRAGAAWSRRQPRSINQEGVLL